MISLVASLILVTAQETAAPVANDERPNLVAACKTIADATSFAFEQIMDEKGGFRGDSGPVTTTGVFQRGSPVCLVQDTEVAYLAPDDQLIHSVAKDKWETFDAEAAFSGGGGGDREWMMKMFSLLSTVLPHQALSEFGKKVADVQKEEKDGATVFSGTLSEAGAEEFSGAGRLRDMASRFGGGDPELKISGTYTVHLKDGALDKVVLQTTLSGDFGGRAFDRERTTTLTLKDIGKAKLEVPADVLACIEI